MNIPTDTCLVWLRSNLRTYDHPAFEFALSQSSKVAALFIYDDQSCNRIGASSKWWLHHALKSLQASLSKKNIPLILMKGESLACLGKILSDLHPSSLVYQKAIEPHERFLETQLCQLSSCSITSLSSDLLHEPSSLKPSKGTYYQVFTPFYKRLMSLSFQKPTGEISKARELWPINTELCLEDLELLPKIAWDSDFYVHWDASEKGGWQRANTWLDNGIYQYAETRDRPDLKGTSELSPYLHFGQISPRQLLFALQKSLALSHPLENPFARQLAWREFAHHLLWHAPRTIHEPLRCFFQNFPWNNLSSKTTKEHLNAWKKGLTGYPIVDAAMRQLWKTGWMHNRLRMIVGSFLVKDLHINWSEGTAWFWDTLLDADLANNTFGWQWISGCGADAAPFFRIFNPVTQSKKFDPEGHFIRRFVPELKNVPTSWIHTPWDFENNLKDFGLVLGKDYPYPIVDHSIERERALKNYEIVKRV